MVSPSCKLGLVLPERLHAQMLARAKALGRGGLQAAYAAAFDALLLALDAGVAVPFPAVRGAKIRVTVRLPVELCQRIRDRIERLTLKLTDFVCAAVCRAPIPTQGA